MNRLIGIIGIIMGLVLLIRSCYVTDNLTQAICLCFGVVGVSINVWNIGYDNLRKGLYD